MPDVITHRFTLCKDGRKKIDCPQCGHKKRFVLYIDNLTGEALHETVGKCDRANNCGHHFTPSQFKAIGGAIPEGEYKPTPVPDKPIDSLPMALLEASTKHYQRSNFYEFFCLRFGKHWADRLFSLYCVGSSKHWEGAALFPLIDEGGLFRQCQIILYNPETGRRIKEGQQVKKYNRVTGCYETVITDEDCGKVFGRYLTKETRSLNLESVLFGQHLLTGNESKTICLVESFKAAMIAAVYMPQYIWMATGGVYGVSWYSHKFYKLFEGRNIILFPDLALKGRKKVNGDPIPTPFEIWTEKAKELREKVRCNIRVSDMLEKIATDQDRQDGNDIADYLLRGERIDSTGLALTDEGYPLVFDYSGANRYLPV